MTNTRQTEPTDPHEGGDWGKTADIAGSTKNQYVAIGTVDPETATVRATVIVGDAEPIEGQDILGVRERRSSTAKSGSNSNQTPQSPC
jgi:hypothetical protein